MIKCFYHSADIDGHCAGASVKNFFLDAELVGINYGDAFPWDTIKQNDVVWMVDFSLQPFVDMQRLNASCFLIWIDHHKSALEERDKSGEKFNGLQRDGIGACSLVWEFLNKPVPLAVRLLAEYDVWNHKDLSTLPFQYGLRLEDTRPENEVLWHSLFEAGQVELDPVIMRGETVLKYINQENEKYVRACAFDVELDGLKCIAVNKMLTNSQLFDSVWNPEKYHAMLTFGFRKGKWTVSLYSTRQDVDVSAIAKAHGGGGHKGASGFQCESLPF